MTPSPVTGESESSFEWISRPNARFFREIRSYKSLESTNDLAARLSGEGQAPPYWAIVADHQTRGRGQRGRTWNSQSCQSLLLSLVLPSGLVWARPSVWCAWVATALVDLVRNQTGLPARIKWPNDILVNERKLAGILIEQSQSVIVGIGLNLLQQESEFQQHGLGQACSLRQLTAREFSRDEILHQLLDLLETRLEELERGDFSALESSWKQGLGLMGKEALIETHQGTLQGRIEEVSLSDIQIKHADGSVKAYLPEQIRHMFPLETELAP